MTFDRAKVFITGLRGIPGVMGGVETHCEELLPRVAALVPELRLEVLGRKGFIPSAPIEFRGVRVRGLPAPRGATFEAIGSTFLAIFYAARRARVLHIHAIGPALLTPLARALGMRVVVTHHGADYAREKWGSFAKLMLRLGEQLGVSMAHQVIAVSPSLASELKKRFPSRAQLIHYIPNGAADLPDAEAPEAVLERFELRSKEYILAVGRLVPEKGIDYLIRAFRKSGSTRELILVGSDVHEHAYSKALLSQAGLGVRFIGSQPRSVLRRLYEHAGLFVLPSFHEGLPISALEAASCGTPMLLSDIQANLDLGLPADHYFPVGDEEALAALLAADSRRFLYDADQVRRLFDWDLIAAQTARIYRQTAGLPPA